MIVLGVDIGAEPVEQRPELVGRPDPTDWYCDEIVAERDDIAAATRRDVDPDGQRHRYCRRWRSRSSR